MKRLLLSITALALILAPVLLLNSCAKENQKHELTVVVTANKVRVANAVVHVYVPVSNSYIKDWFNNADEKGEVHYSFENKVIVELVGTKGSFKGCGFAEVEAGENIVYLELLPWSMREDNGCMDSGS